MFDYIALIIIFLMALGCASIFDCKIGKTMPLVVSIIICVELICGFLNHLEWGLYILIAFLIVCIGLIVKDFRKISSRINFNVIFVLIVSLILLKIHHANTIAHTWDELAQWAVTVRYSYFTNWFAAHSGTNSIYPDYPPATAMFHYFWMKIGNNWQDNRLYISMGIMTISYLVPVLDEIKLKRKFRFFILTIDFVLVFIILAIFPKAYSRLTVDCIMGIIFAWLLYNVVLEENRYLKVASLTVGSFVLIMVKKSAIIFVIFVLIMWATNIIIEKNKQWLYLLGTSLIAFIERGLWSIYVKNQGIATTFGISMKYREPHDWQKTAFANYFKALFDYSAVGNTSQTVFWINKIKVPTIIVIIALVLCGITIVNKNRRYKVYNIILFFELLLYVFLVSYLYLRSFGEGEVAILSSMSRYLGTFLLGNILFFIYIFIHDNCFKDIKQLLPFILLCFVPNLDPKYLFTNSLIPRYQQETQLVAERYSKYEKKALFIQTNVDEGSRIHVFNGSIADMNYILTPMKVTSPLWQSGEFGWFESYSHRYDYVFFDNVYGTVETDSFSEQYVHLFYPDSPILDYGLYKVMYVDEHPKLYYLCKFDE
ncbi:MAG: hypothetical protein GX222_07430 [Ruminococcaceae bacterium]|nr:hypothetical protein [Oscillospiraceae bacterium]